MNTTNLTSPPHHKRNRLQNYNYAQNGWYFTTICTKDKKDFFGRIENNNMVLNECGSIAKKCWLEIPHHFPDVILDEFIIMPNHIHGIIVIENNIHHNIVARNNLCAKSTGQKFLPLTSQWNKNFCSLQDGIPWQTKLSRTLSSIVRGFKIGVTKWCYKNNHNDFQWQISFYDHIIRDEKSLNDIREYIIHNPLKWGMEKDREENLYL